MNQRTIYFAVKALILLDGKFLAMHKNGINDDWWELPGGRMEFGETAEETVVREVKEETGLVVKPIKLLDTWNSVKEEYQITGIIFLCTSYKGEIELSDEHDKYTWLDAKSKSVTMMHNVFKDKMLNWDWDRILN